MSSAWGVEPACMRPAVLPIALARACKLKAKQEHHRYETVAERIDCWSFYRLHVDALHNERRRKEMLPVRAAAPRYHHTEDG
jgi:hypothetical protein